jgi:hypothetical protein
LRFSLPFARSKRRSLISSKRRLGLRKAEFHKQARFRELRSLVREARSSPQPR